MPDDLIDDPVDDTPVLDEQFVNPTILDAAFYGFNEPRYYHSTSISTYSYIPNTNFISYDCVDEPINYHNTSITFYGDPFQLLLNADNGNYAETNDNYNMVTKPEPNATYLNMDKGFATGADILIDSVNFGEYMQTEAAFFYIENYAHTTSAFDRNKHVENQWTANYTWNL